MSNTVQIDPNVFATALAEAIKSALEVASKPLMEVYSNTEKPEPKPRKRGRPKKVRESEPVKEELGYPQLYNTEIISVKEEDLEVLNEPDIPPFKQPSSHMFAAKRITTGNVRSTQATVPVTERLGEQKFIDIAGVKHEKENWEPTERSRPPAQMIDFTCAKCHRQFKDYPSRHPEAFFRVHGYVEGTQDSALVKCDNCAGPS